MATYLRGLDLTRDFPPSSTVPYPTNTPIAYGSGPGAKIATGLWVPPTVSFTGGSLPDGWTVDTGTGGSYTMVGDRIRLGITSGTSKDSIFPGSTVDNSVGPVGVCPDIDFDVAVQVGSDIHVLRGVGFGIFVKVGAATWLRASWYCNGGSNGGFSNLVRTEYSAYTTDGSTVTQVTGSNAPTGNLFEGGPSWFRLKRAGSTWTSYVSGDGITWLQERSWTAAITGVSAIKFGLMNTTTTSPAKSFDLFQVVDLGATSDPRPSWVKTFHTNTVSTDFSSGLPSWLSTYTGTSGTAGIVSSKLRLTHRADLDRSYAAAASNRTPSTDHGLLCEVQYGTITGQPFFDPGIAANSTGTGVTDQYSPAGGNAYIIEMPASSATGNHVRAVRRTASTDAYTFYSMATTAGNGFESAYTHYLGDSTTSSVTYTNPIWLRLEYADGRFRCKWWQGLLTDEPGTWLFDGADRISQSASGGVQSLNWAHNDTSGATSGSIDTADVLYVEMYDLQAAGGASLSAASSLAAVGTVAVAGSAALNAAGSLASAGTVAAPGVASLTAASSAAAAGTVTVNGTAPLNAAATLAVVGTVTRFGSATMTGSSTFTGAGTVTAFASANLAAASSLAAVGVAAVLGSSTANAATSLTAAGTVTVFGVASFAASSTLASAGTVTRFGVVTFAAGTTAAAAGTVVVTGSAPLNAASSLSAAGQIPGVGIASLPAATSLSASGTVTRFGSAPLTAVTSLNAAAGTIVTGSASLTAASTISTAGTSVKLGTASLTAAGTVTASGQVVVTGSVTFTAATSLAAAANLTIFGSAPLNAASTLNTSAQLALSGSALLAAAATLTVLSGNAQPTTSGSMNPRDRTGGTLTPAARAGAGVQPRTRPTSAVTAASRPTADIQPQARQSATMTGG